MLTIIVCIWCLLFLLAAWYVNELARLTLWPAGKEIDNGYHKHHVVIYNRRKGKKKQWITME